MIAGAVAFTLSVTIPIGIALFGAFIGTILNWAASGRGPNGGGDFEGREEIQQVISDGWATYGGWLIAAVIAGIIIWILGYLSSLWILRGHKVHRPVAVTWSALGVAIVATFVISAVTSPLVNLTTMFTPNVDVPEGLGDPGGLDALRDFDFTPFIALALVGGLIGLLVNAVIGLLSWWWMAHALRERPALASDAPAGTPPGTTRSTTPGETPRGAPPQ